MARKTPARGSEFTLAAEAHHRIGNHLALIAALIRRHAASLPGEPTMPTDAVRSELREIGDRIDTLGHLNRMLAGTPEDATIDLGGYIRQITEISLSSNTDRARVSFDFALPCIVSQKQAVSIGMIVGEVLTNALKYAHPTGVEGAIVIACRRDDNENVVLEIADDGVGLPEGFDPATSGSLGFTLIRSLAAQLVATLEFDQSGIGLCVRLTVRGKPDRDAAATIKGPPPRTRGAARQYDAARTPRRH